MAKNIRLKMGKNDIISLSINKNNYMRDACFYKLDVKGANGLLTWHGVFTVTQDKNEYD